MNIVRAEQRFHGSQDGIESWHCFSSGRYYDPANVTYGAVIGCDEHVVAPGAGFDWHNHRGVEIVSWILDGVLQHEGPDGERLVRPGEVFVQSAGDGIRHRETNGSNSPLRFVQMTVLASTGAQFQVWSSDGAATSAWWHVFVASGRWLLAGEPLGVSDSMRGAGALAATGNGALLVWTA